MSDGSSGNATHAGALRAELGPGDGTIDAPPAGTSPNLSSIDAEQNRREPGGIDPAIAPLTPCMAALALEAYIA